MEKFNLLLELCQTHCREVSAVFATVAAQFKEVTIVRGVANFYKIPHLQQLATACSNEEEILQSFTNWGEERFSAEFPETKLLTALMPSDYVNDVTSWFEGVIKERHIVFEPNLLLSYENSLTTHRSCRIFVTGAQVMDFCQSRF